MSGPTVPSAVHRSGCGYGGDQAPAGLETEESAAGRRDPDRAAAVATDAHGHHAAGDRGRGAAAGAARRVVATPRVAGDPVAGRLGEGVDAELRHVRLAHDDRSGRAQPPGDVTVLGGRGAVGGAAEGRHRAGDDVLLLDGDRHPVQRSQGLAALLGGVALGRLRPRRVGQHGGEGVELRVEGGDARQRRLEQVGRRHPAGRDRLDLGRDTTPGGLLGNVRDAGDTGSR